MSSKILTNLKCLFIGESGQGKSSILKMLRGKFIPDLDNPTIGLVMDSVVNVEFENDDEIIERINFEFWELTTDNTTKHFLKDAVLDKDIIFFVFDSKNLNFEKNLTQLYEQISKILFSKGKNSHMVLLFN